MSTNNSFRYKGKVSFITGAGSGIGRATALAFATEGASVIAADINAERAAETAKMINSGGGRAISVHCDVSDGANVRAALAEGIRVFGRLDVAFNNAGAEQPVQPIVDLPEEEWDRIIRIDLRSVFLCMKYEIPLMLESGGGAIVNTSSGAGVMAIRGQAAYCAAKFGVTSISKVAALENAKNNIRVNALCPGIIDTEMISRFTGDTDEGRARVIAQEPIGRMGTAKEIAATVLWLCSDEAAFCTGHAMVVDGAQTAGI